MHTNICIGATCLLICKCVCALACNDATSGCLQNATRVNYFNASWLPKINLTMSVNHNGANGRDCDKWVVITTIFPPSFLAQQLANQSDWCVVIVGDSKGPVNYDISTDAHFMFLSMETQEGMQFQIMNLTRKNHFSRKNVGYLYAISHGARIIYDTDDDNFLLKDMPSARELVKSTVYQHADKFGSLMWNPYDFFNPVAAHVWQDDGKSFGSKTKAWPRGYPLTDIKAPAFGLASKKPDHAYAVGVIQSLADQDPDVDALYRLQRTLPLTFNGTGLFALPAHRYAPWNAQATLFTHDTFWGLLLPSSVHGRVSDIWRSYMVTHIMHAMGLHVVFSSPWVKQVRNAHNYLADFAAELPLYLNSTIFVTAVSHYHVDRSKSLAEVVIGLVVHLYEYDMLQLSDIYLTQAWLQDLVDSGYSKILKIIE